MKYVPNLPPPSGVKVRREVQAPAVVQSAKPVQPRTLPPLVVHPSHAQQEAAMAPTRMPAAATPQKNEKRTPVRDSRRQYCRRVTHRPVLEELRSGQERRRHRQRAGDATEHIDEEV